MSEFYKLVYVRCPLPACDGPRAQRTWWMCYGTGRAPRDSAAAYKLGGVKAVFDLKRNE